MNNCEQCKKLTGGLCDECKNTTFVYQQPIYVVTKIHQSNFPNGVPVKYFLDKEDAKDYCREMNKKDENFYYGIYDVKN